MCALKEEMYIRRPCDNYDALCDKHQKKKKNLASHYGENLQPGEHRTSPTIYNVETKGISQVYKLK